MRVTKLLSAAPGGAKNHSAESGRRGSGITRSAGSVPTNTRGTLTNCVGFKRSICAPNPMPCKKIVLLPGRGQSAIERLEDGMQPCIAFIV